MITLSIITYIIISLVLANHRYGDPWIGFDPRNVNKAYLSVRKSLIYGFTFIPKWALIITATITLLTLVANTLIVMVGWILTNMP